MTHLFAQFIKINVDMFCCAAFSLHATHGFDVAATPSPGRVSTQDLHGCAAGWGEESTLQSSEEQRMLSCEPARKTGRRVSSTLPSLPEEGVQMEDENKGASSSAESPAPREPRTRRPNVRYAGPMWSK